MKMKMKLGLIMEGKGREGNEMKAEGLINNT